MSRILLLAASLVVVGCKPQHADPQVAATAADIPIASAAQASQTSPPPPDWLDGASAQTSPAPQLADGETALPRNTEEIKQERIAQRDLPKSGDPLWKVLRTTRISEDPRTGLFTAEHSAQVKALAGKTLTVSGFMLPIEQQEMTRHFLLSRYTPVCFFCPPGDPNEVVEVRTRKPVKAGYDMVTVSGVFSLADNGEKGLFFRLESGS